MTTKTKNPINIENTSGLQALEYKVLILPDGIEQRTAGGILLPDATHDSDKYAQIKGTIISVGGKAFGDWPEDERDKLTPGARVYYSIYEGVNVQGADGKDYKLCNDKDIAALVTNELAAPVHMVKGRSKGGVGKAA